MSESMNKPWEETGLQPEEQKPVRQEIFAVDLRGAEDRETLHEALVSGLPLPEYYGRNLDALFDALSEIQGRIFVIWNEAAKKALDQYGQSFQMVCRDAVRENPGLEIVFAVEEEL